MVPYHLAVLIRPHDQACDETQWRTFVREQGFGHLAVNGAGGVPVVVPTQFVLDELVVVPHLAKANPAFVALEQAGRALLSVAGDWAYIPGAWKMIGDEDPALGVPTTYYGAVQISGRVELVDDPDEIAALLRIQLADVEPDGSLVDPAEHRKRFAAIRGVRLHLEDVRAKFKYGGNVDLAHRQAVAERLCARSGPGDIAAAARIPMA